MIYFLVNNDYQLIDARVHIDTLRKQGVESIIIKVPHRITLADSEYREVVIESPFIGKKRWLSVLFYPFVHYLIRKRLLIGSQDKLIFYSEYELLNCIVAKFFRDRSADVFMLEDGGFATYTTLLDDGKNRSERPVDRFAIRLLYLFFGLDYFYWIDHGGRITGRIRDDLITGVFVYRDVKTIRNLDVLEVQPGGSQKNISTANKKSVTGVAIYLGQDLYNAYMDIDQYRIYLSRILEHLSNSYESVIYKPHPRENLIYLNRVIQELNLDRVAVLRDNSPVETILQKFPSGDFFSHSSSSCLYLNLKGYTVGFSFKFQSNFDANKKLDFFMQQLLNFGIRETGNMVFLERYNAPSTGLFDFIES